MPPGTLIPRVRFFFVQAAESLCEPLYPVSDPAAYAARNHATFGTLAGLHFFLGSGFVVCGLGGGLGFGVLGFGFVVCGFGLMFGKCILAIPQR